MTPLKLCKAWANINGNLFFLSRGMLLKQGNKGRERSVEWRKEEEEAEEEEETFGEEETHALWLQTEVSSDTLGCPRVVSIHSS